jgi:2-oxoisovalerate dehydrogenase E2 component (dihydrolipoyl transacylase)
VTATVAGRGTGRTFRLPDLGEGLTEAEVVRWLVAEGDVVAVDQPVVEVETAKSVVEVPSPYAGRVVTLHAVEGETRDVGTPLITVGDDPAVTDAAGGEPPTFRTSAPEAQAYREEERAGSGAVLIGYGTSGGPITGRRRRPRPRTEPPAPAAGRRRVPLVISPLVRCLARERGLDLGALEGTGPGGVVTRADVERATAPAAVPVPQPAVPGERRTPLSGFRRAVSTALTRSRAEIPEATVWVDVDATRLWELREQGRRADPSGPGLLAYLARFTVAGLKAYPVLNSRLDVERQEIVELDRINLGLAVQTDRGLVVPAVLGAESMTTTVLDREIRRVTASAREGRATAEEMSAGTFTLNNYGGFGVDGSAAIINHPQVAILGFGRIIDRPWVVDGAVAVRKLTQMSFVFDHRICDGGTAAGFMRLVADAIEDPAAAIAQL